MTVQPHLSVVLPCFNEGSRIQSSLATLETWFGSAAEVLVVDDGSTDDTVEQADLYAADHPNVRVLRLARHRGKGGAIRTAISQVHGEVVVLLDADLAFDRPSAERVIAALHTADMVIGNRRHAASSYSVPVRLFGFLYRRHLVGLLFNTIVRSALNLKHRDTQCGLKAFRRTSLERIAPALTVDGFALDVEILLVARALDLRLSEVPVHVTYESAKSSVKLFLSACDMSSDIFRIAVQWAMGRYAPHRVRVSARAGDTEP